MGNVEVERFFAIVLADHARRPNSPADAKELSQLTHFRGNVLGPNVKRGKTRIAWRYDPHESLSRRRRQFSGIDIEQQHLIGAELPLHVLH